MRTVVCAPLASCRTNESEPRLTTTPVSFVFCPAATDARAPDGALEELSCAKMDGAMASASAKAAAKVRSVSDDFIFVSLSCLSRNFVFTATLRQRREPCGEALFKTIVGAVIFVRWEDKPERAAPWLQFACESRAGR